MPPPAVPPRWPQLFLRQLAIGGSVIAAAEAAGVNVTSAYNRRSRYPEFKAQWIAVLAAREERARGERPECSREGRGEVVPRVSAGGPALVAAGPGRWSAGAEERFLIELSASGSVKRSAAAAGFSQTAVYRRRFKEERFRSAWDAAIETGKARIQALLVEAATGSFDPDSMPIAEHMPKVSVAEAINIAKMNGQSKPRGGDWKAEQADGEAEHQAAVERIVSRLRRLKEREDKERSAASWTFDEANQCWVPPGWARRPGEAGGE